MVKKKYKSKRISLKDKYKIERRVVETNRKRKKQSKKDARSGKVVQKRRDPGIPNSWPFKQELLQSIQRQRQQEEQQKQENKKNNNLESLVERAQSDLQAHNAKRQEEEESNGASNLQSLKTAVASRHAYIRDLKQLVDQADVILQVLDARDPLGTRIPPSFAKLIEQRPEKRMILVLNKCDLLPSTTIAQEWIDYLSKDYPTIALSCTATSTPSTNQDNASSSSSATTTSMEGLLQLLKNYARISSKAKTTIVVGMVGYPNVGKSSLINALQLHSRGRHHSSSKTNSIAAVGVSSRPGFTKCLQEVVLDKTVRLIDAPGVVFNTDSSASTAGFCDVDALEDPSLVVQTVLLKRITVMSLCLTYHLPRIEPPKRAYNDNNFDFEDYVSNTILSLLAKQFGYLKRPGGIPDKQRAARKLLHDWNAGIISFFTRVPKQAPRKQDDEEHAVSSKIVSSFAQEFNVWNANVLKSIEATKKDDDKDELDYLELEEPMMDTDDENVKDMMMMNNDDDDSKQKKSSPKKGRKKQKQRTLTRKELEEAPDYTFEGDDMEE